MDVSFRWDCCSDYVFSRGWLLRYSNYFLIMNIKYFVYCKIWEMSYGENSMCKHIYNTYMFWYIILGNISYKPSCYITSSYCLYITWIAKYVLLCGCSCAWIWKVDPVKLHVRQVHCCVTHLIVSLGAPQRDIFLAHFNRLSFHS